MRRNIPVIYDLNDPRLYRLLGAAIDLYIKLEIDTAKGIAKKAKCCVQTVYRMRNRKSVYPRHVTVMGLLRAVGCGEAYAINPDKKRKRKAA